MAHAATSTAGCLVVVLLCTLLPPPAASQRRGSGRTSLPRAPSRQSFLGRGGRQLAGYGAGGSASDPAQYGGGEEDCVDPEGGDGGGGGVDFAGCEEDPETGFCCVEKVECVASVKKDPILECTHKNVEQCHYTYVTTFTPSQEEVCEENFEKTCSITFNQQAYNETVEKCYTPVEKVCNGQGEEECSTVYESSCTTKYVEKSPGKFVGDTKCEKLPVELCGAGCSFEEGQKECHDKIVVSLVEQPEEVCDLSPQKTCRYATKLVPKLMPKHECTIVPKETCLLKFTQPEQIRKPLLTKWCLDPQEPEPGESYDEENARGPVLSSGSAPQSYGVPPPPSNSYASPSSGGYDSPVFNPAPPQPFPPSSGYGAASSPAEDYDYDYDYGGPSAQAGDAYSVPSSGGYDAPAPSDGGYAAPSGYGAPTSAAASYGAPGDYGAPTSQVSSYAAPLDEAYSSPSSRRAKKFRQESKASRRAKTVLPKRTFKSKG